MYAVKCSPSTDMVDQFITQNLIARLINLLHLQNQKPTVIPILLSAEHPKRGPVVSVCVVHNIPSDLKHVDYVK